MILQKDDQWSVKLNEIEAWDLSTSTQPDKSKFIFQNELHLTFMHSLEKVALFMLYHHDNIVEIEAKSIIIA